MCLVYSDENLCVCVAIMNATGHKQIEPSVRIGHFKRRGEQKWRGWNILRVGLVMKLNVKKGSGALNNGKGGLQSIQSGERTCKYGPVVRVGSQSTS